MQHDEHKTQVLATVISKLVGVIAFLMIVIIALLIMLYNYMPAILPQKETTEIQPDKYGNFTDEGKLLAIEKAKDTVNYWIAPDISTLEGDANKNVILYGKDLIVHTSTYYGQNGSIFKSSTNGMNCQNCHLDAGTKIFGNNYSAVASTYPKYRARSGAMENIYKRVNDCFERSLNGNPIDTISKEMQAIVAYIKWLGKDVKNGEKPIGSGFKDIAFLDRASNPNSGKLVYVAKCQSCHQANGEGLMNSDKTAFTYPPLWGKQSYNIGAGLYRISNFTKYIKYNMPLGANYNNTQLTDEEAWDIAAFVNTQFRPNKDLKKDWPKIEEKPFDHPFGKFTDGFSESQHKYGPYQPIKDKLPALKKTKHS